MATISGFRGLYTATNGELFGVAGAQVFYIDSSWTKHLIGTIDNYPSIVSMVDNGTTLVLVDSTPNGYTIDLGTHAFAQISQPGFYGGDKIGYIDTFFVLNRPHTNQFYSSLSNNTTFDPLQFAAKTGFPDKLAGLAVIHREIWLIGQQTVEVWYNAGLALFPFSIMQGVFMQHGCAATYSIAQHDLAVYWLGQDREGKAVVVRGAQYNVQRITTHAIENKIASYPKISDAIGFVYQQEGHIFYQLTFPSANNGYGATWVYDESTKMWHERTWTDSNGNECRHRANCAQLAYNVMVVGDWQTPQLYILDLNNYTDFGGPIVRRRGYPHQVATGNRLSVASFQADMECGESTTGTPAQISLRWSDDRGRTWKNPVLQSMGATGEYLTQPQWQRLGVSRDRVFELFWDAAVQTALNGAYLDSYGFGS